MTVGRMFEEMSTVEWLYWQAFFKLENEERPKEAPKETPVED